MADKLDRLLAICRANCDNCYKENWLFIPVSPHYSLLCENCMKEFELGVDMEKTRKNLGKFYIER